MQAATLKPLHGYLAWISLLTVVVFALSSTCVGQQQDSKAKLSFEVASLRPSQPNSRDVSVGLAGDRFIATGFSVFDLIGIAYQVQPRQISGGPDWIKTERFDLNATIGDPQAFAALSSVERSDRVSAMMRSFLEERCQLKVGSKPTTVPIYFMTLSGRSDRIRPTKEVSSSGDDPKGVVGNGGSISKRAGQWTATNTTMEQWAAQLSGQARIGRPVIDHTGLPGRYDFEFAWTIPAKDDIGRDVDPSAVPMEEALEEQLGLKLVPGTTVTSSVTIEHIEAPSPN